MEMLGLIISLDISCQSDEAVNVFEVTFFVLYRMTKMRNTPSLRNVEVEKLGEIGGFLCGCVVAQGVEGRKNIFVLDKGSLEWNFYFLRKVSPIIDNCTQFLVNILLHPL